MSIIVQAFAPDISAIMTTVMKYECVSRVQLDE